MMASKSKRARMAPQRNLAKTFMYWATTVFVIKLIIIFSIAAGSIEILNKPSHFIEQLNLVRHNVSLGFAGPAGRPAVACHGARLPEEVQGRGLKCLAALCETAS